MGVQGQRFSANRNLFGNTERETAIRLNERLAWQSVVVCMDALCGESASTKSADFLRRRVDAATQEWAKCWRALAEVSQ